jgi:hypothetical protein
VSMLCRRAIGAMTVASGAAKLALFFVFNVLVLFGRAHGAVTVGAGIAQSTFAHGEPFFETRFVTFFAGAGLALKL